MESADHVCYSKVTWVSQVEELCVQRPYLIPFLYLPCPLVVVMICEVPQPEPPHSPPLWCPGGRTRRVSGSLAGV